MLLSRLRSSGNPLCRSSLRQFTFRQLSVDSKAATPPRRLRKYARRTGYLVAGLGVSYALDRTYNASSITRNLRTLWTVRTVHRWHWRWLTPSQCAVITLDYKLNFTPDKSELIPQLHERVADQVYNLMTSNGGLYIKIGCVNLVMPPPLHAELSHQASHWRKLGSSS